MSAVEAPGTNPAVTGAIRRASTLTGTNFQYLVATAQVESRFNPSAAAPTSSARGLFQFIEQTWLATLKEEGPALGYSNVAKAIERTPSGGYTVSDPRLNDRIMKLRFDPTANAVMAGAYTRNNAAQLSERLGRNATEGELYVAHFLGPVGAGRLISLAESRPDARAVDAFPGQARANPSIFKDRSGRSRSVADVYRVLVNRYASARGSDAPAGPQLAASQSVPVAAPASKPAAASTFAPDTAEITRAYADASRMSELPQLEAGPVFHNLFRSGARREAVAPMVSSLWSAPAPVADAAPANGMKAAPAQAAFPVVAPPAGIGPGGTMSLFQDQPVDAGALFRGRV